MELKLPTTPGIYQLRFVQNGSPDVVLATREIELASVQATLDAPASASAGSMINVIWSGPTNSGNYISIAAMGSPISEEKTYGYLRNSEGNEIEVDTPENPGNYEIRFIQSGQPIALLAKRGIVIK